jgi:hypothetical protein
MTVPSGDEVVFSLTTDADPLDAQASLLVRSLRDSYPDAPVVTFVPEGRLDEVAPAARRYLRAETDVVEGPFPIPEYPLSALHGAFTRAPERYPDADYYVAVDTDTAVLNRLRLPRPDADLYAGPEYVGAARWASADGPRAPWDRLFAATGVDPPADDDRLVAPADGEEMWPPYYNGGLVVAGDPAVPARWLELTREVLTGDAVAGEPYFAEQIALAVLAADRDTAVLDPPANHLMGASLRVPAETQVLHYQYEDTFSTLRPALRRRFEGYGARFSPRPSDRLVRLLSWSVFNAGRVVDWSVRDAYADAVKPVFRWNDPNVRPQY